MTRVSWGAFAVIVSSGLSTGAAFDVDSSCTGLENFALDCIGLGVTDDGFDEMCSTFKETVADPQCIDQAEYVIFFLDQADLFACKDGMGDAVYFELERFKYQCKTVEEFAGPCRLLETFYDDCILPLGTEPTDDELCSLHTDSVTTPDFCTSEADAIYTMEQVDLAACSGEVTDYFMLERFKYECRQYERTTRCSELQWFSDACLFDGYGKTTEEWCEEYVWGGGDASACAAEAETLLAMDTFDFTQCFLPSAPLVDDAAFLKLTEFKKTCAAYEEPTPAPSAPEPTAAGGPCGMLEAFDSTCLFHVYQAYYMEDDFGELCEEFLWGVGLGDDADHQYCAALAATVLYLPDANFNACGGDTMRAGTYDTLAKLREDCAFYEARLPTPEPTHSPAPTVEQVGGPCGLLSTFGATCVPPGAAAAPQATLAPAYCDLWADPASAPTDAGRTCATLASVVYAVPDANFRYCATRMPGDDWEAVDAARTVCLAPTMAPQVAPASPAPTLLPLGSEGGGGDGNDDGGGASSASTVAVAVVLPLLLFGAAAGYGLFKWRQSAKAARYAGDWAAEGAALSSGSGGGGSRGSGDDGDFEMRGDSAPRPSAYADDSKAGGRTATSDYKPRTQTIKESVNPMAATFEDVFADDQDMYDQKMAAAERAAPSSVALPAIPPPRGSLGGPSEEI